VSGKKFESFNPATEEVIARVAEAQKEDVDLAVAAAREAFKLDSEWRTMDTASRGELMRSLAGLMRRDQEYLAVFKF